MDIDLLQASDPFPHSFFTHFWQTVSNLGPSFQSSVNSCARNGRLATLPLRYLVCVTSLFIRHLTNRQWCLMSVLSFTG